MGKNTDTGTQDSDAKLAPENNVSTPTDESQKRQLGDFLGVFGHDGSSPEEDTPTPRAEDEPILDEEVPEPEVEDPTPREEPEDEPEVVEVEEEVEEETSEMSGLRAELAELKREIKALRQPAQEPEEEPEPKISVDPESFLTQEEIDEFSVDPGKVLKTLASRIYTRAREDTLQDLPRVVGKATERQTALQQAKTDFWNNNQDLLQRSNEQPAVGRLIRVTANEIQAENPSWTVSQIFSETAKQVRAALNLTEKAKKIEESTKPKIPQPRKPRGNRRAPEGDTRSGMQKQLDAMIDSVQSR